MWRKTFHCEEPCPHCDIGTQTFACWTTASKLSTKLPQVMIGVQVTPAQPISLRHRAEEGMFSRSKTRIFSELMDYGEQTCAVLFKIEWHRAAAALFYFGRR